jgi:transporter family protein
MNTFIWAILAAVIWGAVPLLEKLGLTNSQPLAGLFYRCLGVLIGFLLLGLFMLKPQEIKAVDSRSIIFLIMGGFLASFVAQICFYNSLKIGEVSRVVPVAGAYPLITFILGILFLGESINPVKTAGALLIITGICALKIG